jgi:hypothetical protein
MILTGGIEEAEGKYSLLGGLAATAAGAAADEAAAGLPAVDRVLPAGGQSVVCVLT